MKINCSSNNQIQALWMRKKYVLNIKHAIMRQIYCGVPEYPCHNVWLAGIETLLRKYPCVNHSLEVFKKRLKAYLNHLNIMVLNYGMLWLYM